MRINYYKENPQAVDHLGAVSHELNGVEPKLRKLVELRVSQINACAFCVDHHSNEARDLGESQQRLDCLPAWEESALYSEKERAALAWAESVTRVSETHVPDALFEVLKKYFTDAEIVDLTLIVSVMNAWNRIAVSFRRPPKKRS